MGRTATAKLTPVLLHNSSSLQAVRWSEGQVQAAFWKAGSLELAQGVTLSVESPCVMLAERQGTKWKLSLSDPSQSLKQIQLSLAGSTRVVDLPQGLEAGSTLQVEMNLKKPQ